MCKANQKKLEEQKGRVAFYYGEGKNEDRWDRITVALIVLPNKTVYKGISKCSRKDNFVKSTGRDMAFGRAISNLEHEKKAELNDFEAKLLAKIKLEV